MRTTITLPDVLIKELQHYAHTKKTTQAVIIAIEEWLKIRKIAEIKKLRGKLPFSGNLTDLRKKEITKLENLDE